jgi:hypothetical protein
MTKIWKWLCTEREPKGWHDVSATIAENFFKGIILGGLILAAFFAAVIAASPILNWLLGNEQWFYW